VVTSKGFRPLFWSGTDVVGIQKNAELIFLEGSKVAALPLRPPPGVEAKGMWWKELRFTILCLVYVSRKSSSHSRRLAFSYFFLWKKKYQKKPLENDYGRFPEQLCGTFVLLWLRLQFFTRGNSWISCRQNWLKIHGIRFFAISVLITYLLAQRPAT
jgi:hypothetical protein